MHEAATTSDTRVEDSHPRMQLLASNVYGFLQLGGSRPCNAGVVLGDPAVLIDGMANEISNLVLGDMLAAMTPRPPAVLIRTHGRRARAHSAGTDSNVKVISAGHPDFLPSGSPGAPWMELMIPAGEMTVRVIDPRPVLPGSSLCAWVPEARVLFTGDILFPHVSREFIGADPIGYLELLRHLDRLRPEVLVPAQGPVTSAAPIAELLRCVSSVPPYRRDPVREAPAGAGRSRSDVADECSMRR